MPTKQLTIRFPPQKAPKSAASRYEIAPFEDWDYARMTPTAEDLVRPIPEWLALKIDDPLRMPEIHM